MGTPPQYHTYSLAKVQPLVVHLVCLPKRGMGSSSVVSTFSYERVPMSALAYQLVSTILHISYGLLLHKLKGARVVSGAQCLHFQN